MATQKRVAKKVAKNADVEPVAGAPGIVTSEKERLLTLYQTLKDLGIRSISDLENLIARAE